jgi:cation transport ATPase
VAIGFCAAGLVTPVAAAVFMPASSLAVVSLTTVRMSRRSSWM